MADDVLRQGVQSIAELILVPGEINLDFADVKTIMNNAGPAWMAIGKGSGEERAVKAAKNAIESPLLEMSIEGAKGVIFNVTGGTDLKVSEVQQASEIIAREAHPDANIIFGMVTDPKMENEIKLTVIATGFPDTEISFEDQDKIEKTLKETIEDDSVLDLPPFLRNFPNQIENKK
jgi:cell division protein FtsZ